MTTYFIRHTEALRIDDDTRERLWNERRIAIHYPHDRNGKLQECDNSSIDPADYDRGRHEMERLVALAKDGGYVCAEHARHNDIQVGWVAPASPIEIIKGHWSPRSEYPERIAKLKTIRLEKVLVVDPATAVSVLAGRPQQGTISQWHVCQARVRNMVEHESTAMTLGDLLSGEQEAMCAEFLRLPAAEREGLPRLVHLLLPVGRTMKDVDIVGIGADGMKIFAQVTYHSDEGALHRKLEVLLKYADGHGSRLVLFCGWPDQAEDRGAIVFPMQRVFELFTTTDSGARWLSTLRSS